MRASTCMLLAAAVFAAASLASTEAFVTSGSSAAAVRSAAVGICRSLPLKVAPPPAPSGVPKSSVQGTAGDFLRDLGCASRQNTCAGLWRTFLLQGHVRLCGLTPLPAARLRVLLSRTMRACVSRSPKAATLPCRCRQTRTIVGERKRSSRTCLRWTGESACLPIHLHEWGLVHAFLVRRLGSALCCAPRRRLTTLRWGSHAPCQAPPSYILVWFPLRVFCSVVTESLPNAMFRVTLDANEAVIDTPRACRASVPLATTCDSSRGRCDGGKRGNIEPTLEEAT